MTIPTTIIDKFRDKTNDDFRRFVKNLEHNLAVKAVAGYDMTYPECQQIVQVASIITVLVDRVEELERKLNEKKLQNTIDKL